MTRTTTPALQLPRTLSRPQFTDISRDALAAAAPELAAVPAEFIRHGLRAKSPQMQAGIAALAPSHLPPSIPRSHLPQALTVPLRAPPPGAPAPPSYPTHALAIAPPAKSSSGERDAPQAIFPVHAVVLAAHCAKIPRLPSPPRTHSASASVTLPVLPLALPSPQAYSILHAFMYTHRLDAALASLLPMPPAFLESLCSTSQTPASVVAAALNTPAVRHTLAAHLCASSGGNLSALMAHAGHVKELWQDMVALGMYDLALWDALDLAWEVVLGAMNLAAQ
ncbi:Clampless protein 1 [Mycena venus]|uniref:Clampless protein 1 n=1 Tax=Mycena venus TaxID=2733690 RepID=A0A8H7CMK3_9AGAR|nr:Clampless protein 1 [Mycena venus]